MPASIIAVGMAAPAVAQTVGPNDAFIDQIGDNASVTAGQTGADEAAYVLQLGPRDPGRHDASAAEVSEGKLIQERSLRSNAAAATQADHGNLNQSSSQGAFVKRPATRALVIPATPSTATTTQGSKNIPERKAAYRSGR